jgi:ATP-dependent DNA helicase PIF1
MLNEIRIGKLSPATEKLFYRLQRELPTNDDGIMPTRLFPRREDVDQANSEQLHRLPGEIHRFIARDSGKDSYQVERLPQNCIAPTVLELKLNAQVMLLKNIDEKLVNGSLGRVIAFRPSNDMIDTPNADIAWPLVRFQNGREMLMTPQTWSIEMPNEGEVARREQASYSVSIIEYNLHVFF